LTDTSASAHHDQQTTPRHRNRDAIPLTKPLDELADESRLERTT